MCGQFATATFGNVGYVQIHFTARIGARIKRFPGFKTIYRFPTFCRTPFNTRTKIDVVFCRTPFQIFGPVVRLDFVFMVDLWQPVRIRNKCQCNQPMYFVTLAFNTNLVITRFCLFRPVNTKPVFQSCDTALVANLVITGQTGYFFPRFHIRTILHIPGRANCF